MLARELQEIKHEVTKATDGSERQYRDLAHKLELRDVQNQAVADYIAAIRAGGSSAPSGDVAGEAA